MRSFNCISRHHQILIITGANQNTIADIINIISLMFGFRDEYYPPNAVIVPDLYDSTVRTYFRTGNVQGLPQSRINTFQRHVNLLLRHRIPFSELKAWKFSLQAR